MINIEENFSKIRLVGLDLDGTVFTTDKRMTKRTKNAIANAIKAGITVIPATGRPIIGIPEEFTALEGVRYLLGSNGAAIYDQEEKQFVVHDGLTVEAVLAAMEVFGKEDCAFEAYINGVPYISRAHYERIDVLFPDPHIRSYVKRTRKTVEDLKGFLVEKKQIVEKVNVSFPSVENRIRATGYLDMLHGITGVSGVPHNLELCKEGIDKGEGLLALGKILGLTKEQILACGDSENDLAMIQKSGMGIAMGNAVEAVKKCADFILPYTNDEDAVAWLLERMIATRK